MIKKIQIEVDDVISMYCGQNCKFLDRTYLDVGKGYRCTLFSSRLNCNNLTKNPERLLKCIQIADISYHVTWPYDD
jgi:hypothetical protein